MKKMNDLKMNDLKIYFYFYEKNYPEINLINLIKTNFIQQILTFKKSNIGCGGQFSFIYDNSLNFFF
jgi:hypothetical protein